MTILNKLTTPTTEWSSTPTPTTTTEWSSTGARKSELVEVCVKEEAGVWQQQRQEQVWYLVQSYPNPEGVRTLRTPVPCGVCDALRCLSLGGIRITYAKVCPSSTWSKTFKFIRKFELLKSNSNEWTELIEQDWKTKWDGLITVEQDIDTPVNISAVLPAALFNQLRRGHISSISHRLKPQTTDEDDRDDTSSSFKTDLIVTLPNGTEQNAADYYQNYLTPHTIEIALPLRKYEAEQFFDDSNNSGAIRHTFLISHTTPQSSSIHKNNSVSSTTIKLQLSPHNDDTSTDVQATLSHIIEISNNNKWEYQHPHILPTQNGILQTPCFRIKLNNSKLFNQSIYPWLTSNQIINMAHQPKSSINMAHQPKSSINMAHYSIQEDQQTINKAHSPYRQRVK